MTQSLSILMNDALPLVLLVLAGLLTGLLFWFWQRRRRLAKSVVPDGENHPAIPRREYKRSELEHSKLTGMYKPVGADNKLASLGAKAYHIHPDLWDV